MSLSRILIFLGFTVLGLSFFSCKEEQVFAEVEAKSVGEDYYPLFIGKFITYQVDSVLYKSGESPQVVQVIAREVLTDTLRDNEGELIYRVERSERLNDTLDWVITKVFTVKRTLSDVQRVEDNQRIINLTFPPNNNPWNGIIYNSDSLSIVVRGENILLYKDWTSRYETMYESMTINNVEYDSVLVVTHANGTNAIEQRINREVYAKGIGLVHRSMSILDSQLIPVTWPEDAEKGFTLEQTIIDHN